VRWIGHVSRIGERLHTNNISTGKHEGKRPLGRPKRRREDIRMNMREIRWEGVDWIHLLSDRGLWRVLVNTAMRLRVP